MALMGYNSKLTWVVAAALLWSLLGLSLATGSFKWRLGSPPGALELPGCLAAVVEGDELLTITMAVRSDDDYMIPTDLPSDLSVLYQVTDELPMRPRLELQRGRPRLRGGQRGFGELDTERYLIRFSPQMVRIIPKGHRPLFAPPLPPDPVGQPNMNEPPRNRPPTGN